MSDEPTAGLGGSADLAVSGSAMPADDGTVAPAAAGTMTGPGEGTYATPRPVKKRNFFRRHLAMTSLLVIFLLLVGSAGGFLWYLNHELGNIKHIPYSGITQRFDPVTHQPIPDSGNPLNILILGSDDGDNVQTVADDLADGTWTRGAHRSDTIILVHVPADRKSVQVISLPRDSWVRVPTFPGDIKGKAKMNAAFSWGGPALAVRTIQRFTGLHIDHLAMIDWNGFKGLTDALGGVRVYIPKTFTDDSQHVTWRRGWQTLDGETALQYVRTRHGLEGGDFGLIHRQQNFLRTIMNSLLSTGTFLNPIKLARVVGTVSSFVQVDDTWSTGDIRDLALSSRNLRAGNVQFTTAPFASYDRVGGQSIVRLDAAKCEKLFRAFDHGDLTNYLKNNPGSSLPGNQDIK
jgi:LCP family protein required for cell wall assembly